ncbi:uncharacterized protein [Drosophila takahashii]|uniref:uncharacterized protein isoform X2 n=1 Tax=Drosophila takahashii TaxID=29030 RepID=UPI0038992658
MNERLKMQVLMVRRDPELHGKATQSKPSLRATVHPLQMDSKDLSVKVDENAVKKPITPETKNPDLAKPCDVKKPIKQMDPKDNTYSQDPKPNNKKPSRLSIFDIRKPTKKLGPPPEDHVFSMSNPKRGNISLWELCDPEKLFNQMDPKDPQNLKDNNKEANITLQEPFEQEKPTNQMASKDPQELKDNNKEANITLQEPLDPEKLSNQMEPEDPQDLKKNNEKANITLQEPCDQQKPPNQMDPKSPTTQDPKENNKEVNKKLPCDDDKPISQLDHLSDPGPASSHSSLLGFQDNYKKVGFLLPAGNKEFHVMEPLIPCPKIRLNTWTLNLIPDSKQDYMKEWLSTTVGLPGDQIREEPEPVTEEPAEQLPIDYLPDSDDEALVGKNPFASDVKDAKDAQDAGHPEDSDEGQADERMMDLIQRAHYRVAIPDSCVTDAIFMVDRPRDAVALDKKLPAMRLQDICQEDDYIQISVCKVYSPFQFWFQFVDQVHGTDSLQDMHTNINSFYNHDADPKYRLPVSSYYLKAGYICAAKHRTGWRRARILVTPPKDADWVSIYYVDYASAAEMSPNDLRFLPDWFTDMPALAARGTLSHIHPLGLHWPPDSTRLFRRSVLNRQLHAHVVEMDAEAGILFLRVSQNKDFDPSINKKLVNAKLAGRSMHYTRQYIEYNCGRRVRYLRERLPSFEILESRLIPLKDEEFESEFDDIIYSPSFFRDFQVPELQNPFRSALLEALDAWMPAYRKEQELLCADFEVADQKLREEVLARKKLAAEELEKEIAEEEARKVEEVKQQQEDLKDPAEKMEQINSEEKGKLKDCEEKKKTEPKVRNQMDEDRKDLEEAHQEDVESMVDKDQINPKEKQKDVESKKAADEEDPEDQKKDQ